MRLDEALDTIPPHGLLTRLRSNLFGWLGYMQSAPGLMTLLVVAGLSVGFLSGISTLRYQLAHQPRLPSPVVMSNTANGTIANVSGIVQTPNSAIVQVTYNRVVPETVQGSLDDPQIRQLLLIGTKSAATNGVRTDSVALLANECRAGHECVGGQDGSGIRSALLVSLRYDKSPAVRLNALDGLQPYVVEDQRVRDAGAGGPDARYQPGCADARHQPAAAGRVGFERAQGDAHRIDYGRESVYPQCQFARAGGDGGHSVGTRCKVRGSKR